jgi:hypothetical protein
MAQNDNYRQVGDSTPQAAGIITVLAVLAIVAFRRGFRLNVGVG